MNKKAQKRKKQNNLTPVILIGIGVLLVIVVLIAQLTGTPAATNNPAQNSANIPEPAIQRVTLADAKSAFDAKSAVFVDVRSDSSYQAGHIPGSLSIPFDQIEARMGELDPNQWIITYCTWPAEQTSAGAARILIDNGYTNVEPLLGGFEAWQQANYPVE